MIKVFSWLIYHHYMTLFRRIKKKKRCDYYFFFFCVNPSMVIITLKPMPISRKREIKDPF